MFTPPPAEYGGTQTHFAQGETAMDGHCFGFSLVWLINTSTGWSFGFPSNGRFESLRDRDVRRVLQFQNIEHALQGAEREQRVTAALLEYGLLIDHAGSKHIRTDPVEIFNAIVEGGYKLFGMGGENPEYRAPDDWNWNGEEDDRTSNEKFIAHAVASYYDKAADTLWYFDPNYGEVRFEQANQNEAKIMIWFLKYLGTSRYAEAFNIGVDVYGLTLQPRVETAPPSFTSRVDNILGGLQQQSGGMATREQAEDLAGRAPGLRFRRRPT